MDSVSVQAVSDLVVFPSVPDSVAELEQAPLEGVSLHSAIEVATSSEQLPVAHTFVDTIVAVFHQLASLAMALDSDRQLLD